METIDRFGLSKRELEVLQVLSRGLSKKEIAGALYVSRHTIDTHLRNIYYKLDVGNGIQAVVKGIKNQLIHI